MSAESQPVQQEIAVDLQNVHRVYRRDGQQVAVLAGVSLEVAAGEFLALMGPSGSGKTTLLNLAFGGSADFFKHPAHAIDAEEYLAIYPEYMLSPAEREAFLRDRRRCIVGLDTAKEFGWEVGDAIQLEDRTANLKPFAFVVSGIYHVDNVRHPGTDARILFFHHKYLEEATEHRTNAGFLDRRPTEGGRHLGVDRRHVPG